MDSICHRILSSLTAIVVFSVVGQANGQDVAHSAKPVIMVFSASWGDQHGSSIELLTRIADQGYPVRAIDIDREVALADRWKILEIPTCIVLEGGREANRFSGRDKCREFLQSLAGEVAQQPKQQVTQPDSPSPSAVDPMACSVRIRIEDGSTTAFGTGTMIDQHQDEVLVLTCGHLFRGLSPAAQVLVEFPFHGRIETLPAVVVDYQANETDIGLISFRSPQKLAVAKLMSRGIQLREGESVCSVGCDHGANPSRRDSHITKLNRYMGPQNVEVAKAPVQGRSGGGLFNNNGELIGVCYAAEQSLDEGLYSGPEVVYAQLSRLGLSRLYQQPNPTNLSASTSIARSDQPANNFPDITLGEQWKSSIALAAASTASSSVNNQATHPSQTSITAIVRDEFGRETQLFIPSPSVDLVDSLQRHAMNSTNRSTHTAAR